jgi:hypothetical protein
MILTVEMLEYLFNKPEHAMSFTGETMIQIQRMPEIWDDATFYTSRVAVLRG